MEHDLASFSINYWSSSIKELNLYSLLAIFSLTVLLDKQKLKESNRKKHAWRIKLFHIRHSDNTYGASIPCALFYISLPTDSLGTYLHPPSPLS